MTNDENTTPPKMWVNGRQTPPWPPAIRSLRMDLQLAKELRLRGTMLSLVSRLNELLHAPAEACAAGWHVGIPVVHAEEMMMMLRRAKRLAPALPDVARDPKVPAATATAAIVTCPDVVEGEYWEAPSKVVTCRMWRVREVMRFTSPDACAIVRMEDPRPDSPAGQRLLTASTMEHDGWRRATPDEEQAARAADSRAVAK